jgi:hypothetical protein
MSTHPASIRRWMLCLAVAMAADCFSAPAPAADCAGRSWPSTHLGLQQARAAIPAPSFTTIHTRARCARNIAKAVMPPDAGCTECVLEYSRLLTDVTAIQREGYSQTSTSNRKVRKEYLETEFAIRRDLHFFLMEMASAVALEQLAKLNIAYAGSCIELLAKLDPNGKQALLFHELATSVQQNDLLGPQSLRSWAKAVRSCDNWDISSGENRDDKGVRAMLCGPDCRSYLRQFTERVGPDQDGLPYVPQIKACRS